MAEDIRNVFVHRSGKSLGSFPGIVRTDNKANEQA